MNKRCTRGGDKCEAVSCNPPTFGPRGDYQIQAQSEDYQTQAQREGYQNEERHRGIGIRKYWPKEIFPDAFPRENIRHPSLRACPKKQPGLGTPCSVPEDVSCSYGSECCCGKCHASMVLQCSVLRQWAGFYTDACMRPNCGISACPKDRPSMGSPCSVPESETCSYGSECCCGKCHPSFQAKCDRKYGWSGLYTDACMRPNCGKAACPKKEPTMGSPCSVPEGVSCTYGSECCCGKCHPSFKASCDREYGWSGFYTEACMNPYCEQIVI